MHPIQCQCGTLRGELEGTGTHNRVICYCADCSAFARFLDKTSEALDHRGGTEIIQVAQSRLRFLQGEDRLAAIRLSDNGMIRWYASCCGTPIGNTLANPGLSFIGLIHTCLDRARLDEDFGSHTVAVNTATATAGPALQQRGLPGFVARLIWIIASSRLGGGYKKSPLFTAAGLPRVTPKILPAEALARLKNAE